MPQTPLPFPTTTAVSAGAPQAFPDTPSFSFEERRIDGNPIEHVYFGTLTFPGNIWNAWTMNGLTGIATNGAALIALNPDTDAGADIAFLKDTGSMQTTISFPAGSWRIRAKAAQRLQAGGLDRQTMRLSIGSTAIAEWSPADENYTEFVSRVFHFDFPTVATILIEGQSPAGSGNMALLDEVLLEPLAVWDDPASWTQGVPDALDDASIPEGVLVAIKGSAQATRTLQLSGELLAADRDTELQAQWILVYGSQALFGVGTAATPFLQDFTLTLVGSDDGTNIKNAGNKFLSAMNGGTVQLHGEERVSWTQLRVSANPGNSALYLVDPVDWGYGDEIIIAGSNHQRSTGDPGVPNYIDHAEHKRIQAMSFDGLSFSLDTSFVDENGNTGPLAHYHHGGAPQTYVSPATVNHPSGQSWELDQRAEIGLLSHNVKIQGDLASASGPYRFGGHLMVMRENHAGDGGKAYVSNVEFYRMGQERKLGRYPMHWHVMIDQAQGQYIKSSAIHHTYNRGVTLHGTDFVSVEDNVVYHTMGHTIFLEEGSEENNKIIGNLVLSTLKPVNGMELLISDNEFEQLQNRCPASFWITNPNNEIRDNVAAGTEGTGFWFIFPKTVMGHSLHEDYLKDRIPYQTDLDVFDGNTAHSCGSAFDVNDSIYFNEPGTHHPDESINKNVPWDPEEDAILTNFTTYACDMGVYAGIGNDEVFFENFVIADNNENARFAAYHTIRDSVFVADTGNVDWGGGTRGGYVVYDGAGRAADCHFEGFNSANRAVIRGEGGATLHPNHLFSGITLGTPGSLPTVYFRNFAAAVDSNGVPIWDPALPDSQQLSNPRKWGMAMRDLDGSLWGVAGSTIIGNHPLMFINDLSVDLTPSGAPSNFAKLSKYRFGHLRIRHPQYNPGSLPDVTIRRDANALSSIPATVDFLNPFQTDKHKQFPVIVEDDYSYTVTWPVPHVLFNELEVVMDDVQPSDAVYIRLENTAYPALVVSSPDGNVHQSQNLGELYLQTGVSYLIDGRDLWIKYVGVDKKFTVNLIW